MVKERYNTCMEAKNTHTMSNTNTNTTNSGVKTARKKRVDRNHIIYELRVNGGNYIGVTAKTESTVLKSVSLVVRTR